jgi:hypothetical protein
MCSHIHRLYATCCDKSPQIVGRYFCPLPRSLSSNTSGPCLLGAEDQEVLKRRDTKEALALQSGELAPQALSQTDQYTLYQTPILTHRRWIQSAAAKEGEATKLWHSWRDYSVFIQCFSLLTCSRMKHVEENARGCQRDQQCIQETPKPLLGEGV